MRKPLVYVFAVSLLTAGCMDDPHVKLPSDSNSVRKRSVVVDISQCLTKQGEVLACDQVATKDMQRVAEMRGVIGAPASAVKLDDEAFMRDVSYGQLSAFWSRIPVGYGCDGTIQGVFPDKSKSADDLNAYKYEELDRLVGAVRTAYRVPLWTAAYGLGDAKGVNNKSSCTYGDAGMKLRGESVAEQLGTPIGETDEEIAKWAKVVRQITKRYNRTLPESKKDDSGCNPQPGAAKDWWCSPSLFNIEFGRDPNGAGGYTDATKGNWLKAYKAFASELRAEFPYPGNDVLLIAPSVIIRSATEAEDTSPTSAKRSWLYDFVDYVVANKLKLSLLSFEVEAASPVEARNIVQAIRAYVDSKGLKDEDGRPMRLFVTDLRLNSTKVPASLKEDAGRFAAYQGAFYSATKTLWQGLVFGATMGRVVRFPTQSSADVDEATLAKTSLDSDLLWFDQATEKAGSLKPTGWATFWFNRDFLGSGGGAFDTCVPGKVCTDAVADARRKGMVAVTQGPDALGNSGKVVTDPNQGLVALATRENCVSSDVDQLGEAVDCVPLTGNSDDFPAVTEGRQRVIRVLITDMNIQVPSTNEVLMHQLRLEVRGLPTDTKTVGYRWARMNGNVLSWQGFVFPEQGVADVHDGTFHVERTVAVPSMHYFELLY